MARLILLLTLAAGCTADCGGCIPTSPESLACLEPQDCPAGACCDGVAHRCRALDASVNALPTVETLAGQYCALVGNTSSGPASSSRALFEPLNVALLGSACGSDAECGAGVACLASKGPDAGACILATEPCFNMGCVGVAGSVCVGLAGGSGCVAECNPDARGAAQCGPGAACSVMRAGFAACLPLAMAECTSNAECSPGDVCIPFGSAEHGRCFPACGSGGTCAASATCRHAGTVLYCAPANPGVAGLGQRCAHDVHCEVGASCVGYSGFAKVCRAECSLDAGCSQQSDPCVSPDAGRIGPTLSAGVCFDPCSGPLFTGCGDTPLPSTCVPLAGLDAGICIQTRGVRGPAEVCDGDTDCQSDLQCVELLGSRRCRRACLFDTDCGEGNEDGACHADAGQGVGYCFY